MPVYRAKIRVQGRDGMPDRDVVTCFAGCIDAMDARAKFRTVYDVVLFHWVKPLDGDELVPARPHGSIDM